MRNPGQQALRLRRILAAGSVVPGMAAASFVGPAGRAAAAPNPPGAVWSWGRGAESQIGDGGRSDRHRPVSASGLADVVAISSMTDHVLALQSDGTVWAWGQGRYGRLGNGSVNDSNVPVQVRDLGGVTAVSAGALHSLALKSDGSVWAWGYGGNGNLGNGQSKEFPTPVRVGGLPSARAVAAGFNHSLVLTNDGSVWGWGVGPAGGSRQTPGQIAGLSGVAAIAAGDKFSLALKSDGSVWAWGENGPGRLGNGSTVPASQSAVQVAGLPTISAISANATHALAIGTNGELWSWGSNKYGQLGAASADNCPDPCARRPVRVGDGYLTAAAGDTFTLAVKADHSLWTWGSNASGELGTDIPGVVTPTPVQVAGLPTVWAVSAGHQHGLAIATPLVSVNPTRLNFGEQVTSSAGPEQTIYVSNDGSAPLNAPLVVSVSIGGQSIGDFNKTADTCSGGVVPAGSTCQVSFAFAPTGTGPSAATVTLSENSLVSTHAVELAGIGVAPPPPPAAPLVPEPIINAPAPVGDDGMPTPDMPTEDAGE